MNKSRFSTSNSDQALIYINWWMHDLDVSDTRPFWSIDQQTVCDRFSRLASRVSRTRNARPSERRSSVVGKMKIDKQFYIALVINNKQKREKWRNNLKCFANKANLLDHRVYSSIKSSSLLFGQTGEFIFTGKLLIISSSHHLLPSAFLSLTDSITFVFLN